MNSRLHPHNLIFPGIAFGVLMILLSFALVMLAGDAVNLNDWYPTTGIAQEILLGIALGLIGAGLAWAITNHVPAFARLRDRLTAMMQFEALTIWHAIAFGLMAGFPEEMLFRGAIQSYLGIFLTALIFGGLHAVSGIYFLYATFAGILLGMIVEWRGNLWAATTTHFVYDMVVFLLLAWYVSQQEKSTDEIVYS